MKKNHLVILLVVLGLLVSACGSTPASKPDAKPASGALNQPVNLKFASMSVGGSWYVYAVNIAELIKPNLPNGSKIEVLPHQGGVGNPILVSKGSADLGLSFSVASNWAYKGLVDYAGKPKMDNLRAIVGGLNKPHKIAIMVKETVGIKSLQEIKDKKLKIRLITVQRGGAGETLARQVLEAYGMNYDEIKNFGGSVNHIDLPVAVQQMQDGQADIFIHNVGYKQPDIVEMTLRGGISFLALEPDKAKYLVDKYGHLGNLVFEKGEFTGIDTPVPGIGYPTGVIVSDKMSPELAYIITKAICENKEKLKAVHASLADFDPTTAWTPAKNGYIPLHPGAEKFYKEKGWMK